MGLLQFEVSVIVEENVFESAAVVFSKTEFVGTIRRISKRTMEQCNYVDRLPSLVATLHPDYRWFVLPGIEGDIKKKEIV